MHTLRFRLKDTDYNLPMCWRTSRRSVVAREVIEKYGESDGRAMSQPGGLRAPTSSCKWVRSSKIVLGSQSGTTAASSWDFEPQDAADRETRRADEGQRRCPRSGRVEVSIIEEDQSRWLAFQNGELDIMNMEGPLAPQAIVDGKIKPELADEGHSPGRIVDPEISLHLLELRGPGRRRPLPRRRSRCRRDGDVLQRRRGHQGDPQRAGGRGAVSDPAAASSATCRTGRAAIKYDPAAANALLDTFRLQEGRGRLADAARRQATGRHALVASRHAGTPAGRDYGRNRSTPSACRWTCTRTSLPELLKLEKQCKLS